MVDERCGSCRFHGTLDGGIICDYLQITGKARITRTPREAWDKPCPFFERGKKVALKFKPLLDSQRAEPRYRFDQRKMRVLYDQGLNDHQIALQVGCTSSAVKKFRERNKLPSQWRKETSPC